MKHITIIKESDCRYDTIMVTPHWKQYVISQLPALLTVTGLVALMLLKDMPTFMKASLILLAVAGAAIIGYAATDMARRRYVVTDEQIIFHHGVLARSTDYLELYRVVDYQQNRTIMQQLTGMKTITILSGDRNTPQLNIIGVENHVNIIPEILRRVDYNKKRRGIYEITNR